MRVVFDLEGNKLKDPDKIWVLVARDIDKPDEIHIFRNLHEDNEDRRLFRAFAEQVTEWVGHNILVYDFPVMCDILKFDVDSVLDRTIDTLVISKLAEYSRDSHSLEGFGEEFGIPKNSFSDFTKYSLELEKRCIQDTLINLKVYLKYIRYIRSISSSKAIKLENSFIYTICNTLEKTGFYINKPKLEKLLAKVTAELAELDAQILSVFKPRAKLVKEITPKLTQFGTINRSDFRWVKDGDLTQFNGGPFCRIEWQEFNPASHKQVVNVLNEAGWKPINKTKTFLDVERELSKLKHSRERNSELDLRIKLLHTKIKMMEKTGWKIDEDNIETLPKSAPAPARLLGKRILLESRRRTLTEWLELIAPDGRIRGKYFSIGAWTQRMAHREPNTANIPTPIELDGSPKLYGAEMRSLWCAPKGRLLIGVDLEGIQLRIFAHYINDLEFTKSLVEGKKEDETDPHSLNRRILGRVCKSRSAAKRYIYALLLGAGLFKLASILDAEESEAKEALDRLIKRYEGFAELKETRIPADGRRGYFLGLDGRKVPIPGTDQGHRRHLAMSGYLQCGEQIIVKMAITKAWSRIKRLDNSILLVNIVHDEYVLEVPNDHYIAEQVIKIICEEIENAGIELGLLCPLKGDGQIGSNWKEVH